uniref:LysM, putative peptidoglycan-binding, domain containing 1 n=1 Tax=Sphaeramia orbicularis TaxID=375764 RepID=A0A673A8G5_9TELE
MEQIKRANRLYTNDSIFLKKSLSIPVMSCDLDGSGHQVGLAEEELEGGAGSGSEQNPVDCRDALSELTPGDFLKRLDGLISQSKHAAVKGCEEAEKRCSWMRKQNENTSGSTERCGPPPVEVQTKPLTHLSFLFLLKLNF